MLFPNLEMKWRDFCSKFKCYCICCLTIHELDDESETSATFNKYFRRRARRRRAFSTPQTLEEKQHYEHYFQDAIPIQKAEFSLNPNLSSFYRKRIESASAKTLIA